MLIEINLLPQEFRKEAQKNPSDTLRKALYAIPLTLFLLVVIHGYLAVTGLMLSYRYGRLENKWSTLEKERKEFDLLNKEYNAFTKDTLTVGQFMKERMIWSEKLNKLSLLLPSGIWFEEIYINGKEFTLRGSAVSLQKKELELINKFLANLKKDPRFYKDFSGLELGSVKRETIGSYDIINFVITGVLK